MIPSQSSHGLAVNWSHPLNRQLVAWWLVLPGGHRGSQWRDVTGQASPTKASSSLTWEPGRPGAWGSLKFPTGDRTQKASVTRSGLPTGATSAWTFSFWHRTSSAVSLSHYFGWGGTLPTANPTTDRRSCLLFNSNYYWWGASADWDTGIAFDVGTGWHHALFTTPGGSTQPTITFYLNGVARASGAPANPLATALTTLTAGSGHDAAAGSPDARLDDGRVWARALSADEVRVYYTLSRHGYPGLLTRARPVWARRAAAATGKPWHYYHQQMIA